MATELYSPMIGKVIELLVKPGDAVEEDEPVLVLEALKMKMPIVAPVNGTLEKFCVEVGQDIETDTVLAIIAE
jgi:biotin carboxyl carrier protein